MTMKKPNLAATWENGDLPAAADSLRKEARLRPGPSA